MGISFANILNQKHFGSLQKCQSSISDEAGEKIGRLTCSFLLLQSDKQDKSLDKALQVLNAFQRVSYKKNMDIF